MTTRVIFYGLYIIVRLGFFFFLIVYDSASKNSSNLSLDIYHVAFWLSLSASCWTKFFCTQTDIDAPYIFFSFWNIHLPIHTTVINSCTLTQHLRHLYQVRSQPSPHSLLVPRGSCWDSGFKACSRDRQGKLPRVSFHCTAQVTPSSNPSLLVLQPSLTVHYH